MHLYILVSIGALIPHVVGSPTPSSTHIIHEKREIRLSSKWVRRDDVTLQRDVTFPLSFGLVQNNLEKGYEWLMDVSHPDSENYGKHWSMEKIADTFAASAGSIQAVKAWLTDSGIDDKRLQLSKGRNWIKVEVTVEEAESLLRTEYSTYTNIQTGKDHFGCDEYSVPANIREHIDFITPTVQFDAIVKQKPKRMRRDTQERAMKVRPVSGVRKAEAKKKVTQLASPLTTCNQYITPDCLRALYNFTNGTTQLSSYGIVQYSPEAYLQSDLNLFYFNFQRQIPQGYAPILASIDGGTEQTTTQSFDYNGEADLDIEYGIALVYPQNVTVYQAGDQVEGASFNNLLDALDASYCTSGGGDDPNYDAFYPDTAPGGYTGKESCGTFAPAKVISTSYGYNEADLPASYEVRQCNEYMKLGLAGVTFLFSSGDSGVAGLSGECCTSAKCAGGTYSTSGTVFNPGFPATCPYVTAVGATQVKPNTAVTAPNPEQACQTGIYSGGGFSNNFALPSYQSSAVKSYFSSHLPSYSSTQYNNSQAVRGYPDVSANGASYQVVVDGSIQSLYGSSCAAPTFGAIIVLINEQRAKAGKSSVGFINPTIYANPSAFNDITTGGNAGCGTNGFTAVSGWDPVTGLGTPNYSKLLPIFLALK